MELEAGEVAGAVVVEGRPGVPFLSGHQDANRVLEACFYHGARLVLLYAENLPAAFFDLSSGQAGEILQKFRNYRVRLAVVAAPGGVRASSRFGEMVAEESRGPDFGLFETRDAALEWLAGL